MPTRNGRRKRSRGEPDPLELTRLVLAQHQILVLGKVRNTAALPIDLVGIDSRGWPVLVAVPSDAGPADRLDLLVRLLSNADLADMAGRGCKVLAAFWGPGTAGVRTVDVLRLTAADYQGQG
jgi:hypothetical protein